MLGGLKPSLLTEDVKAVAFTKESFAVGIFIDLQTPESMKDIEQELLKVLNGEQKEYDYIDQLFTLHADKEESIIDVHLPKYSESESHSTIPTLYLYNYACSYNIYYSIIESVNKGEKPIAYQTEYDRRMNLVNDYNGLWVPKKSK